MFKSSSSSSGSEKEKTREEREKTKERQRKKAENITKMITLVTKFEKLDKDMTGVVINELKKMVQKKPTEKEEMRGYVLVTKALEKYKAETLKKVWTDRFKNMTHDEIYAEYKRVNREAEKEVQMAKERQARVKIETEEFNRKYREERKKEREEQKARFAAARLNEKSSSSSSGRRNPSPSYHRD
jgi:hypothetical protein